MIKWNCTDRSLPDEYRAVLCKYGDDGLELFAIMTMIGDEWVTDASESALYGCEPNIPIDGKYVPHEWAYID